MNWGLLSQEKAKLENNIQAAVAQQGIDLEDAIDLRQIKNVKLANQLLKIKRRKMQVQEKSKLFSTNNQKVK